MTGLIVTSAQAESIYGLGAGVLMQKGHSTELAFHMVLNVPTVTSKDDKSIFMTVPGILFSDRGFEEIQDLQALTLYGVLHRKLGDSTGAWIFDRAFAEFGIGGWQVVNSVEGNTTLPSFKASFGISLWNFMLSNENMVVILSGGQKDLYYVGARLDLFTF